MPDDIENPHRRTIDTEPFSHTGQYAYVRIKLEQQEQRLSSFIEKAEPLLKYAESEQLKNERRTEMYDKITEHVLGWGIIAIIAFIGAWIIAKLKLDLHLGS